MTKCKHVTKFLTQCGYIGLFLFVLCFLGPANQAKANDTNFSEWIAAFKKEALREGVSSKTANLVLDTAMLDKRILKYDRAQPEHTITFAEYADKILSPARISEGRRLYQENRSLLEKISQTYGVPASVIVALWGIESNFGKNTGKFEIIDSLLTLAYDGRRPLLFRKQLISALKILDTEGMRADALRGSWAGALGQCQFMPSTFLAYAVDFDGDGHRDIWNNKKDVFASIANYLAAEGWQSHLSWGGEVTVPESTKFSGVNNSGNSAKSVENWLRQGIILDRPEDGQKLAATDLTLIQPDGVEGRSFLVTENYQAVMRWNKSTYFATSVGLLADEISTP